MKKLFVLSFLLLATTAQAKDMTVDVGMVSDNAQSAYDGDRCKAQVAKNLTSGSKSIKFACYDEYVVNSVHLNLSKEQTQELIKLLEESVKIMESL
jgi:hypothetical protein